MKTTLAFLFTLFFSVQSLAADLQGKDVGQWLESMKALEPWMQKHQPTLEQEMQGQQNPELMFKRTTAMLKKHGLYDEFNGQVQKQGYRNVEHWSQVTEQVTFAWMALEMQQNKAEVEAAKAQYDAMKNNPNIPAEQKKMMEQMMGQAFSMMRMAEKSSPADRLAVEGHQLALRKYFNKDQ